MAILYEKSIIPAGGEYYIILLENGENRRRMELWNIIVYRLHLEIIYTSIYDKQEFRAAKHPWQYPDK